MVVVIGILHFKEGGENCREKERESRGWWMSRISAQQAEPEKIDLRSNSCKALDWVQTL